MKSPLFAGAKRIKAVALKTGLVETTSLRHRRPRIFAALLAVVGLVLIVGGTRLLMLGGSLYYLIAGLMCVLSGALLWRGRSLGSLVYGGMLLGTISWAVWEVGFDAWALMPRVAVPMVIGLWFLTPWLNRGLDARRPSPDTFFTRHPAATGALALMIAVGIGALLHAATTPPVDPILQAGTTTTVTSGAPFAVDEASARGDWLHYGNDQGGSRFSPLDQINRTNVEKLQVAWTYRTGVPLEDMLGGFEDTPLKVGRLLYLAAEDNDVIALDAESGKEIWRFEVNLQKGAPFLAMRGVAYYKQPETSGACAERILMNTQDARLIALDALTGAPCQGFGSNGEVSLLTGMGEVTPGYYYVTSAPTIVRGRVVLGGWVADNQYWGEPSGVVRAFDAVTGSLAWAWDMGRPERHGEPPPGDSYTHSTPNAWAPMSADETLGLVYVPTGNATPDFYGGQRRPFDEAYASAVVAIDALTGKVRWKFQAVHHDLWDYDTPSQPTLVDIPTAHGVQHALIQPTKQGEIFLLDRQFGTPLADVRELPAPQGALVPGERLSPTQPFSVGMPSFRGPDLREQDMWGITPLDQLWCRISFKEARYDGPYTPPGFTPSIQYPGPAGGVDWGSISVDLDRHLLIANHSQFAFQIRLLARDEADRRGIKPWRGYGDPSYFGGGTAAQAHTPVASIYEAFVSPLGTPCPRPPWGYLSAVDLTTHKLVWSRPFGTARDVGPFGIPTMLPIEIGTPSMGGPLTTRGGLTFIGAAQDNYFRAFDSSSGELLWQVRLPAAGNATPMTYTSPAGRQIVIIAVGGSSMFQTKRGDYVIAFALPE
ncbi:MAG TPA: membrane-bound PQQ-dependent dehydrogenase, glucose/quinate/shikimate family [Vicinamibacterales bacterium]|nr:membrane-bound PQQ-dependent dehydrogenase, glucose/quinate/shikimate family [Vicinamibacterales bacterium]